MATRQNLETDQAFDFARSAQADSSASTMAQHPVTIPRDSSDHPSVATAELQGSETVGQNDDMIANTDWAFLNMLGDAGDEFYSMDTDFRQFLGSGFDLTSDYLSEARDDGV